MSQGEGRGIYKPWSCCTKSPAVTPRLLYNSGKYCCLTGIYKPLPDWFCTCKKCGPDGKQLKRVKWYVHNPGGKFAIRMQRTPEEIQMLPNPPPPRPTTKRKRRPGEAADTDHTHISKRVAGSSSVRTSSDHNICASTERYW